jgi:hypothetical protein
VSDNTPPRGRVTAVDDQEQVPPDVLDLDTRFGLDAFGSEGAASNATASQASTETARVLPAAATSPRIATPDLALQAGWPPVPPSPAQSGPISQTFPRLPVEATPTRRAAVREPSISERPYLGRLLLVGAVALVSLTLVGAALWWLWLERRTSPAPPRTGDITIQSTPAGARVVIDGHDRGKTPVSLSLPPGMYQVELRAGDERHLLPIQVKAGSTIAQHVFLRTPAAPPARGGLRVTSEPGPAAVSIDGQTKGRTPVLITDLTAGPHDVVVKGTTGEVRQRVQVEAGTTTTIVVPLARKAAPETGGGWVSISSPTELQVFEGDRLLGTTRVDRIMLPAGPHTLRFSNAEAGVEITRDVRVEHGRNVRLPLTLPPGVLSVNALPWASVSIDGRALGDTPLGEIEVSPGSHEVVFTHPTFGERRRQIAIRAGAASRLSVDMRQ